MALFIGENVYPRVAQFTPLGSTPTSITEGALWYDLANKQFKAIQNGIVGPLSAAGMIGGVNSQSGNYTAVAGDSGKLINFNANPPLPAFVQIGIGAFTSSVTSVVKAFPTNNSLGNLLIVSVNGAALTGLTISDTQNNSYTNLVTDSTTFGTSNVQAVWFALNSKAGPNTVTVSWTGATTAALTVVEYSGIKTSSALDQNANHVNSNVTNWASAAIATTQAVELVLVHHSSGRGDQVYTTPGYTLRGGGFQLADQVITMALNLEAQGFYTGGSSNSTVQITSFKGTAATPAPQILTLPAVPPSSIWMIFVSSNGSLVTINPNGNQINGTTSSFTLQPGTIGRVFTDGTNYFVD